MINGQICEELLLEWLIGRVVDAGLVKDFKRVRIPDTALYPSGRDKWQPRWFFFSPSKADNPRAYKEHKEREEPWNAKDENGNKIWVNRPKGHAAAGLEVTVISLNPTAQRLADNE